MSAEPDSNSSECGILAHRLRAMVQQPVPESSETIDIEQLLRRLLMPRLKKLNSRRRKLKKWTTEHRETLPDPGGGGGGGGVSHPDQ